MKPKSNDSEVKVLDLNTVQAVCAQLCDNLGFPVESAIAHQKVFGVMSGFAEVIDHADFHFGFRNRQLSNIPLPFAFDPRQEVMYLNRFDGRAIRTSYGVAQEIFAQSWRPVEDEVLIIASDLTWALMVNHSGGVAHWLWGDSRMGGPPDNQPSSPSSSQG